MWCCLCLTILQNDIQEFLPSFELSTLGSERVKKWITLGNEKINGYFVEHQNTLSPDLGIQLYLMNLLVTYC